LREERGELVVNAWLNVETRWWSKTHGEVSLYTIVFTSGSPVNPKEQLRNGNAAFGMADNPR
jgi:hypothetical protein